MRRLYQPIPNVFSNVPAYTPGLEFTGNPHDAVNWQNAVGNAREISLVGYRNHMKLDVLQFVRFIDQVNPDHISNLNSENTTNLSRTTQLIARHLQVPLPGDLSWMDRLTANCDWLPKGPPRFGAGQRDKAVLRRNRRESRFGSVTMPYGRPSLCGQD
jgi:hypothetical protein